MSTAEKIRRMLKDGASDQAICEALGVTPQRIYYVRWNMNHPEKRAEYARSYWRRNAKRLRAKERERRRRHKERREAQRKAFEDRIKELERELAIAMKEAKPLRPRRRTLIKGPSNWYDQDLRM